MAKKQNTTGIVIALIVIIAISYFGTSGFTKNPLSGQPLVATPAPLTGATAYCPATSGVASIGAPPPGCFNQAQILQITPQIWNPGIGSPTGTFNAAATQTCKIFVLGQNGWVSTENIKTSASGVCTTSNTYLPGSQVVVQYCVDSTPACVTADYSNTKTVMYCALPSIIGSGLCNQGPGAGYVPFSTTPSASTAPTQYFYMPIQPLVGDATNGQNAAAQGLYWQWQNGTQVTASNTNACFVNTGANACDLPKATSTGRFYATVTLQPVGTLPASPQSFGYASFTPIDPSLQSGTTARGALNYVLTFEIKATTNNDMCTITSTSFQSGSITPTIISRGGSGTDTVYVYVIPDSWVTRTTDASGNTITSGTVQATVQLDCNQVYNGSGDVNAFCVSQWAYFSTKYFNAFAGNTVNPEAVKVGSKADNAGLTCSASAYTVLVKT